MLVLLKIVENCFQINVTFCTTVKFSKNILWCFFLSMLFTKSIFAVFYIKKEMLNSYINVGSTVTCKYKTQCQMVLPFFTFSIFHKK